MEIKCNFKDNTSISKRYISIGGGSFHLEDESYLVKDVYPFKNLKDFENEMDRLKIDDPYQLIIKYEDKDIFKYCKNLIIHSFKIIEEEINSQCVILSPLNINTVANSIYKKALNTKDKYEKRTLLLSSFAYGLAEANAKGKIVVTTPTCGSCGVVPSCLYYEYKYNHKSLNKITKAFIVGAFICNFIKQNASISGALLGCQAEIGSASSFAAASLSYLNDLSMYQIEYASEVAMEHFLGLTCDPIDGYVMIPCIERNAIASIHAYSSYLFAKDISIYRKNKISFDNVISAMYETGKKMNKDFKETSKGGLAKIHISNC